MHARSIVVALAVSVVAPVSSMAQRPDMSDQAFASAVSAILTHDHFAVKCAAAKGLSAKDSAEVAEWSVRNQVSLVRVRMRELEQDQAGKRALDDARAGVLRKFGELGLFACRAALQSTRRPEAQFGRTAPRMLTALAAAPNEPPRAVVNEASTGEVPSEGPPPRAEEVAVGDSVVASIESFGFDTRTKMGVGGFLTLDVFPVVLFRNGEALKDVSGLSYRGGLQAHRQAHPADWTRWRRADGRLQLAGSGGWKAMAFTTTYARLPDELRLNGLYRNLSGTGNIAVGGNSQVAAWSEYRFWPDGRVARGGGAGAYAASGDASVATRREASNRRGQYRVEGFTLRIVYDDGSTESRVLITDPTDPKGAIWLDGVGYVQR